MTKEEFNKGLRALMTKSGGWVIDDKRGDVLNSDNTRYGYVVGMQYSTDLETLLEDITKFIGTDKRLLVLTPFGVQHDGNIYTVKYAGVPHHHQYKGGFVPL